MKVNLNCVNTLGPSTYPSVINLKKRRYTVIFVPGQNSPFSVQVDFEMHVYMYTVTLKGKPVLMTGVQLSVDKATIIMYEIHVLFLVL